MKRNIEIRYSSSLIICFCNNLLLIHLSSLLLTHHNMLMLLKDCFTCDIIGLLFLSQLYCWNKIA
nr:MAG TPA: hypothetical protein [Caudoviricetes sp.]